MLKAGMIVLACVCIATVVTETVGLGILWSRGQLNKRTFREIEVILTGTDLFNVEANEAKKEQQQSSLEDIDRQRVIRILKLEKRESLVKQFFEEVENRRAALTEAQTNLTKIQETFYAELKAANDKNNNLATEKARGILLASSPKDAVNRLMELTVEDDIILLNGMPEESVAAILKAFKDEMRTKKIFEALNRGEPTNSIIGNRLNTPQPKTKIPNG